MGVCVHVSMGVDVYVCVRACMHMCVFVSDSNH